MQASDAQSKKVGNLQNQKKVMKAENTFSKSEKSNESRKHIFQNLKKVMKAENIISKMA